MKAIKRFFSIIRAKNARGLILIIIVIFNIFLWFGSSTLAFLFSPGTYGDFITSLWKSGITWMLEPGFYDPSVDHSIRILSIIVILTSMITFSGGIIGYVASLFSAIIEQSESGKSRLFIYDHILILNWNAKAVELITDYGYDEGNTHIVILSAHNKKEIESEIDRKLFDKRINNRKIKVIVREGEVLSKSDLVQVHIEQAKAVIVLCDEFDKSDNQKYQDITSIKTLMLMNDLKIPPEQTIIVEVKSKISKEMINNYISQNTKFKNQIITLIPDEMMGRLIAQSILMPSLSDVYLELFSFKGAEFYTIPQEEPNTFLKTHSHAIPLFTIDDSLYLIAESHHCISIKREEPITSFQQLNIKMHPKTSKMHIVIFGKNNKLEFILDSIRQYEKESKANIRITHFDSFQASSIVEEIKDDDTIDTILILSDDKLEKKDFDVDVLLTLLMTQDLAKKYQAKIVIELLEPKHYDIAKSYRVTNTIISNEYISKMMTQLSKNRRLNVLYQDLLTYDDDSLANETYEIYAYVAKEVFQEKFPIVFPDKFQLIYSVYESSQEEFKVIGIVKNGITSIFKGNLDKKEDLIIEENDIIIMICR
ncbi:MAG: hypothetical protein AB7V00_02270 [Bacilli bacterium]